LKALATAYQEAGQGRKAREILGQSADAGTAGKAGGVDRHLAVARAHLDAGEEEEAAQWLERVLKEEPGHVAASLALGTILYRKGQHDGAVPHFQAVLRAEPGHARAHYFLGVLRARQEQFPEARRHLEQAAKATPEDGLVWKNLGFVYIRQEEWARAEEALQRAKKLLPADDSVGSALSKLQAMRTTEGKSSTASPADASSGPNRSADARNKARSALEEGQLDECLAVIAPLLDTTPDDPDAHEIAGQAWHGKGEYEKAQMHYRRALETHPNDPHLLYNLAASVSEAGDLEEARSILKSCVEAQQTFAACWFGLGVMEAGLGNKKGAQEAVRRLKKLDPAMGRDLEKQVR
jgi:tetratricopeptide (TPR) repeat protein